MQAHDGKLCNDSEEKANILNEFFCSVYTIEDTVNVPMMILKCDTDCNIILVSEHNTHKKLKELNPNKSDPDKIHPRMLKESNVIINKPVFETCSASLQTGKLPDDWRKGYITPIYKSGNRNLVNS